MTVFQTEQEAFWAGEFGDQYIGRNPTAKEMGARLALFARIMARTNGVESAIEFGANIGNNLRVLDQMFPAMELDAVEINEKAAKVLTDWGRATVHHRSILDFTTEKQFDLAFVSGVLIHINPDMLPTVYERLHAASRRYVCLIEYYNPSPVEVSYRGHSGRLFKRDFAGEMLTRFGDLRLIDYGFVYHGDPNFPLDDLTWFLMEKA
ncbi:MAG: pseudaminic acid biosynthesis-associated methylase [Thermodesulfobacteriota bacterium]